jgi:hypothetical protein
VAVGALGGAGGEVGGVVGGVVAGKSIDSFQLNQQ